MYVQKKSYYHGHDEHKRGFAAPIISEIHPRVNMTEGTIVVVKIIMM